MRAINHALTGSLIGLTIGEPAIAAPAAFLSHFVCDMIPHHGGGEHHGSDIGGNTFRNVLIIDAVLCFVLVVVLVTRRPQHWLLAVICAFLAASPDFLFVNRYVKTRAHKKWQASRLVQWTMDIQWFQRPIGATVEAAWFVAAVTLLIPFLR